MVLPVDMGTVSFHLMLVASSWLGIRKFCDLACHIQNKHSVPPNTSFTMILAAFCARLLQKRPLGLLALVTHCWNFFCYWKLGLNFGPYGANPFLKSPPNALADANFRLQSSMSWHLFTNVGKSLISIGPTVVRISSRNPPSNLTHFQASSGFFW